MSDIDISYGGQAVIGGVLIQSPKGWSLGIRDKDENLHRYYEPRIPLVRRNKFWAAPFIRGFGALIDSMYVGFKAITLSEKIYSKFEDEEESLLSKVVTYSVLIAVLLLFIAGPRLLVEMINYAQIGTGIIEGLFRGVIVIIYIYLIGRTKDAQELFEYHGAEHMTIASYEDKQSLEFDNVTNYPKEHVRCGKCFLFLIVFISLIKKGVIPKFKHML
jgi:Predicted metal-dependent enzyme